MSYLLPQSDANNPDVITNWRKAGPMQLFDGGSTGTPAFFNFGTQVTESTWETVGPTGSGADNIYAAMDVLPAEARAIMVHADYSIISNNTGLKTLRLYCAAGDEGSPTTTQGALINRSIDMDAADQSTGGFQVWIPLDADQIFKLYWFDTASVTFGGGTIRLMGFMSDT
jgi:hypothetical protein